MSNKLGETRGICLKLKKCEKFTQDDFINHCGLDKFTIKDKYTRTDVKRGIDVLFKIMESRGLITECGTVITRRRGRRSKIYSSPKGLQFYLNTL